MRFDELYPLVYAKKINEQIKETIKIFDVGKFVKCEVDK